jgi:signal transduction histidine kinase
MFISMVAHEIKSPLAAIEGQLSAVLSGICGTDRDQEHATLERSLLRARALRTLINDLLNLTAMDTGNFTIRRSRLDLRPIVESVVDNLKERAAEKEITLTLDYNKEAGCTVVADKDSVEMIITNLVDNAVKYTPPRGHVRVTVADSRSHVKITVQDDGIGMSPGEQQHVFEEFYRAKNELAIHVPGTGLGLTLVKRLVEMHDGKIAVASESGKGSTFSVSLPAAV